MSLQIFPNDANYTLCFAFLQHPAAAKPIKMAFTLIM
jgi:hypothetical protein